MPLPHLLSRLPEREACASPNAPAVRSWCSPLGVGGFAAQHSWLSYAWRLDDGPPLLRDPAVQRLRRQLGVGGRWAWQDEPGAEEPAEPEEEAAEAVVEAPLERQPGRKAAGSTREHRGRMPVGYVPSLRGRGVRRSSRRRSCRGRALAGAADVRAEDWLASVLPEELRVSIFEQGGSTAGAELPLCAVLLRMRHAHLGTACGCNPACAHRFSPASTRALQGCMPGQRLTAAQEARCGELAQAAKAAAAAALAVLERQQQQHHERAVEAAAFALAPSVAGGSVAAVDVEQAGPGISELRLVLRQGAAASLLLQRCNLGLVGLMQRRVARGRQLSPALCQVGACPARPLLPVQAIA